jgi:hypothetical protein
MAGRRGPRIATGVVLAIFCVYAALSAGLYIAMRQPLDAFGRVMKHVPMPMMLVLPFETLWNRARGGSLHPGDRAPDFRLPALDHRETVQLSVVRKSRPVVLIFGSYT